MKKISIISMIFVLGVFVTFNACKKDNFTEEDAIKLINTNDRAQDSLQHLMEKEILNLNATIAQTRANYENALLHGDMQLANDLEQEILNLQSQIRITETMLAFELEAQQDLFADSLANVTALSIEVVDATSDFNNKSSKAVEGLRVVVSGKGITKEGTTDANGFVHFTDLRKGAIAVRISGTDYATVTAITNANAASYDAVKIPIFSTATANMATYEGKVTLESNLLTRGAEAAPADVNVVFKPTFAAMDNIASYAIQGYNNIAKTDVNGAYTIAVPADKNAKILTKYNIYIPEFNANQILLASKVNGVSNTGAGFTSVNVPVKFGHDANGAAYVGAIPNVPAVYAVISAPVANTSAKFTTEIFSSGGVLQANVLAAGANYISHDGLRITLKSSVEGEDAAVFQPVFDGTTGRLLHVVTLAHGEQITMADQTIPTFVETTTMYVMGVNATGGITSLAPKNGGVFFSGKFIAALTRNTGNGSGAEINAITGITTKTDESGKWTGASVTSATINPDKQGKDYVVGDEVIIKFADPTPAKFHLIPQSGNVKNVAVTAEGSNYEPNSTIDVKFVGASIVEAEATAHVDAEGHIYKVVVTNPGGGYAAAPTAELDITYKTAKVVVELNDDGEVIDMAIGEVDGETQGEGYVKAGTTVKFYNQATGTEITDLKYELAIAGGKVTAIDIKDPGATKNLGNDLGTPAADGSSMDSALPGLKIVKDFYLGVGKRAAGIQ